MKKLIRSFAIGATILAASSFQSLFAQERNCSVMSNLERIQNEYPQVIQNMKDIEEHTQRYVSYMEKSEQMILADQVYTIPVVVHVLYRTTAENISTAQIQSQIDVLNEDFRRTNADKNNVPTEFASLASDISIQFVLATVDPNGNATTGITRKSTTVTEWGTDTDNMKKTSQGGVDPWNPAKYLNLWVCNIGGGILGYAQFPGGPAATDGVVISPQYFGRTGSVTAPFNKGRTATHEVGHYLNLRHIWGDGACGATDYVSDTPDASGPNYGCPSHPHSTCSSNDMFMNYMDYVDDNCMNMFTAGQKARMRALFATGGARASLPMVTTDPGTGGGTTTPTYCASKGNSTSDEWINAITIGSFSKTTGNNAGYLDATSSIINLTQGTATSISLTPGFAGTAYNEYWKIWVDLNNDADFDDAGELVFDAGAVSKTTVNGTITIPSSSIVGNTRMRISMKYNAAQTTCEAFSYGEVEDYTVKISSAAAAACGVPSSLSSASITSSSAVLSWAAVSGATSYNVRLRQTGTTTWSTASSTSTSLSASSLSAATTYEYQVNAVCPANTSAYSSSAQFTTTAAQTVTYCASQGNSTADEWIENVAIGTIVNTSGNNSGYGNFLHLSTDLKLGTSYTITITPKWSGTTYYEGYAVFIDYNNDGDFDDAGEKVVSKTRTKSTSVSGSFVIPSTATMGATRMRVSMSYNATPTSCGSFSYGEVEDYTVNITTATGNREESASAVSNTLTAEDVVLYPNPATSYVKLNLGAFEGETEIRLISVAGVEVYTTKTTETETEISVSDLKPGIYFLSISIGDQKITKKFIKQ